MRIYVKLIFDFDVNHAVLWIDHKRRAEKEWASWGALIILKAIMILPVIAYRYVTIRI